VDSSVGTEKKRGGKDVPLGVFLMPVSNGCIRDISKISKKSACENLKNATSGASKGDWRPLYFDIWDCQKLFPSIAYKI
jgi:hypothetical protein